MKGCAYVILFTVEKTSACSGYRTRDRQISWPALNPLSFQGFLKSYREWSDRPMVSSYSQYRVVLPVWIVVGQGPVVAGVGCLYIFFLSSVISLFYKRTLGVPYRDHGYVPLRFVGNVVIGMGTHQQQFIFSFSLPLSDGLI